MALQYASVFGMTTVAVDVEDQKLQMAKDLGADHVGRTPVVRTPA
jgi:propanol-preferring alcohol dehydrogenase